MKNPYDAYDEIQNPYDDTHTEVNELHTLENKRLEYQCQIMKKDNVKRASLTRQTRGRLHERIDKFHSDRYLRTKKHHVHRKKKRRRQTLET